MKEAAVIQRLYLMADHRRSDNLPPDQRENLIAAISLIERQSLVINLFLRDAEEARDRLRYAGDLFHDQGLEDRARADWDASEALYKTITAARCL